MPDAATDVLLAYDGSEPARAAARLLSALLPDARLTVLVVHTDPISIDEAGGARVALPDAVVRRGVAELEREIVSEARAEADAGVALARSAGTDAQGATVAAHGSTWQAILEEARNRNSGLIACGTRGLGGFGRALLGSTSSALVHHADRPLLVLPESDAPARGPLLIAYDGSEPAKAAIRVAARHFPGRETVVAFAWRSATRASLAGQALLSAPDRTVRELTAELDQRQELDATAVPDEGAALAAGLGLDAHSVLVPAVASEWSAIAEHAQRIGACVVIAGSRGRGTVGAALLGSMSGALAHNADRPTLIAR